MQTLSAYFAAAMFAAILIPITVRGQTREAQNLLPPLSVWQLQSTGSTTGSVTFNGGAVLLTMTNADALRSSRFVATKIPLVIGNEYHFHCLISAASICHVELGVFPSAGANGPTGHGGFDKTFDVGPSWTVVDEDFTADGIGFNSAEVIFFVGSCDDQYQINSAALYDGANSYPVDGTAPGASPGASPGPSQTPFRQSQTSGWNLEVGGKAQAGPVFSADGLIVDIDQTDGYTSDVQYAREGVTVANGTTYRVHFRARSAETRTIHVEAEDASATHAPIGLSQDVQLTGFWQDFNLTFTAQNSVSGQGRIVLMLGGNRGTIQIATADFSNPSSAASAPPSASPDSVAGLAAIASWELDTDGGAEARVSPDPTGAVVEIDRVDGQPADVILKQDGVGLAEGTQYELQFKAKSTVARQVPVIAQVDGGPSGGNFRMIGCNESVRMTPEWQDYVVKFTAVGTVPEHSRIAFLLGGVASTVALSDVALHTDTSATQTASAVVE